MSDKKSRLECGEDEARFEERPGTARHEPVERPA